MSNILPNHIFILVLLIIREEIIIYIKLLCTLCVSVVLYVKLWMWEIRAIIKPLKRVLKNNQNVEENFN